MQLALGPLDASPINPRRSVDQYTHRRAALSFIVDPDVSDAYPKKTPLWTVVTSTGRSDALEEVAIV